MRPIENIEKLIKNLRYKSSAATHDKVLAKVLQALDKNKKQQPALNQPNIWRTIMKTKMTKFAAVAVVVIVVFFGLDFIGGPDITRVALGDVVEQIYKATSATYKQTFQTEGGTFTNEMMITEPGYMRSVSTSGNIVIWDWSAGKTLQITQQTKKATLTQRVGMSRKKRLFSHLDWVSKLHEDSGEFTGQEELDGQIVDVFVIEVPFEKTTVWVDPETNLPVQVETALTPNPDKNIIAPRMSLSERDFGKELRTYTNEDGQTVTTGGLTRVISIVSGRGSGKGIQKKMTITMHDFIWNAELDESLFSLEPPEGYTFNEQQFDVSESGESGLIYSLAFWTEMSDGFFPPELNDFGDPSKIKPMLISKFDKDGDPEEELDQAMKEAHKILKGLYFVQEKKADDNWNYAGDGVRLGDADTPICWWIPKDSDSFRVIYGDLSIGDTALEELPE